MCLSYSNPQHDRQNQYFKDSIHNKLQRVGPCGFVFACAGTILLGRSAPVLVACSPFVAIVSVRVLLGVWCMRMNSTLEHSMQYLSSGTWVQFILEVVRAGLRDHGQCSPATRHKDGQMFNELSVIDLEPTDTNDIRKVDARCKMHDSKVKLIISVVGCGWTEVRWWSDAIRVERSELFLR